MEGEGAGRVVPADDYEAQYMGTDGQVVLRDKRVSRLMAGLLLVPGLLTVLLGVFLLVTTPEPAAGVGSIALGAFLGLLGVLFGSLRTSVTTSELHVQYGLWGPRVPLQQITRCEVVEYDAVSFGGWGIKYNGEAWAYSLPGAAEAVAIDWTLESGKSKKAVVTAQEPAAVVLAVKRARAEAQRRRTRVAADDITDAQLSEADAALDAELEAEAEAILGRKKA